jgi:ectoine hydroxylase-related dioxygenase (phytanoyl-CoA dioxygenase family)
LSELSGFFEEDAMDNLGTQRSILEKDGIVTFEEAISPQVTQALKARLNQIFNGTYTSGRQPKYRSCSPIAARETMCRVSFPHLCDPAIWDLIQGSVFPSLAAAVCATRTLQAWFIHALRKVPVGVEEHNYVGWHQDSQYTTQYFERDFFTAWIALTDVTADSGPVHYIEGSHTCKKLLPREGGSGFSHTGGFYALKERALTALGIVDRERQHFAKAGSVSFHHSRLLHGSSPCVAGEPRITLVLHLRSELNRLVIPPRVSPRKEYSFSFNNLEECPMVFGDLSALIAERVGVVDSG